MAVPAHHITVCVCTYRRPELLRRLLEELRRQESDGSFGFSVVVADNDAGRAAEPVVAQCAAASPFPVRYCVETRQNIAMARNMALSHVQGDFIAFIDDDEYPSPSWLQQMLQVCLAREVAGVLGPVKPYFEPEPPRWVRKGGFYERPGHPTGLKLPWSETRTGNVLFRRDIIAGEEQVFRQEFGTGGEDQDFFRRMMERGHVFVWCDEAPVYELVPPARLQVGFLLRRALLRGRNSLRHPAGRLRAIAKSFLAVPLYAVVLPFLLLAGYHHFIKYLVKLCDHLGRLLALLRLNPVEKREM
jgi:glycosyltransferase involved in cell wall biosynthesis